MWLSSKNWYIQGEANWREVNQATRKYRLAYISDNDAVKNIVISTSYTVIL